MLGHRKGLGDGISAGEWEAAMTASIIFCRDCKYSCHPYEPIPPYWVMCPHCGGRNFEARYSVSQPVSQAETVAIPRILLERILAEYDRPGNGIYHALAALAQFIRIGEVKNNDNWP